MNRKTEFATNELIRMQSRNYSWEVEKSDRMIKREEKMYDEMLNNFISVMKDVCSVNNKRKVPGSNDSHLCRYHLRPPGGDSSAADLVEYNDRIAKKAKMENLTSTPVTFRERPDSDLDASPVGVEELNLGEMNLNDSSSEEVITSPGDRSMDKKFRQMKVAPPRVEDGNMTLARRTIAANETFDSTASYRSRIHSLPSVGTKVVIKPLTFGKNLSKSVSLSDVDYSTWKGEGDFEFTNHNMFDDVFQDFWVGDTGTYGLERLFAEIPPNEVFDGLEYGTDESEVERLIIKETKNKLYSIFLKQCSKTNLTIKNYQHRTRTGALITPGKRKASSQPELPKDNPTKAARLAPPARRNIDLKTPRNRLQTHSGSRPALRPSGRRRNSIVAPISQPGQATLPEMWRKNFKECVDDMATAGRVGSKDSNEQ